LCVDRIGFQELRPTSDDVHASGSATRVIVINVKC